MVISSAATKLTWPEVKLANVDTDKSPKLVNDAVSVPWSSWRDPLNVRFRSERRLSAVGIKLILCMALFVSNKIAPTSSQLAPQSVWLADAFTFVWLRDAPITSARIGSILTLLASRSHDPAWPGTFDVAEIWADEATLTVGAEVLICPPTPLLDALALKEPAKLNAFPAVNWILPASCPVAVALVLIIAPAFTSICSDAVAEIWLFPWLEWAMVCDWLLKIIWLLDNKILPSDVWVRLCWTAWVTFTCPDCLIMPPLRILTAVAVMITCPPGASMR